MLTGSFKGFNINPENLSNIWGAFERTVPPGHLEPNSVSSSDHLALGSMLASGAS